MPVTLTPINVGSTPGDGAGDTARAAALKINANDAAIAAELATQAATVAGVQASQQDTAQAVIDAANAANSAANDAGNAAASAVTAQNAVAALATSTTNALATKLGKTETAAAAAKLASARRINGVLFDGTQDITIATGGGADYQGVVATYADLPSGLGAADAGKEWLVTADGMLYTWDGTAFPAQGSGIPFQINASTVIPKNIQSGSTYTLQPDDVGKEIWATGSSLLTIVVPAATIPDDTYILLRAVSCPITVVGATGPDMVVNAAGPSVTSDQLGSLMYVRINDAGSCYVGGQVASAADNPPSIEVAMTLPDGAVGQPYVGSITATNINGATGDITIGVSSLPPGLIIGSVVKSGSNYTAAISGTPTAVGLTTSTFTVANGSQTTNPTNIFNVTAAWVTPTVSVSDTTARISFGPSAAANVTVRYSTNEDLSGATTTAGVAVTSDTDYTGKTDLSGLTAGTTYYYTPVIDGVDQFVAPYPSFKTFPAAGTPSVLKFAFGSCTMHTNVTADSIFAQVPSDAALLLQLGDLVYADRDVPYGTTLPTYRAAHRNTLAGLIAANAGYRALRAKVPVFTTWDDHDIANNFSAGTGSALYAPAKQALQEYQARQNPDSPTAGELYYSFQFGDVGFFVLDGRSFRSPEANTDNSSKSILGAAQKAALKTWLLANKDTLKIKFICTSTPAHGYAANTGGDSWGGVDDGTQAPNGANGYRTERNEIWDYIDNNTINGVVFLSGDQHWAGSFKTMYAARPRYEFGASPYNMWNNATYMLPAVARAADPVNGPILWKKDNTMCMGIVTVDTTVTPATVSFQLYGTGGSLGPSFLTELTADQINVAAGVTPMTLSGTLPGGTVGVPYSAALSIGGTFTAPVAADVSSGTLPSWLTSVVVDTAAKTITYSGTPDAAATTAFTARATDSSGTSQVATAPQSITIAAAVTANYFSTTYASPNNVPSVNNSVLTRGAAADAWALTLGQDTKLLTSAYAELVINTMSAKIIVGVQSFDSYLASSYVGQVSNGYGWHGGLGNYFNNTVSKAAPLGTFAAGDIIQIALVTNGTDSFLYFGKNGTWDGDPVAGTGYAYKVIKTSYQRIAASLFHSGDSVTARVKTSEFAYTPPAGVPSWSGV